MTVVVVAVPEGLPLAVTLALAFATTRMLKDNNLVRVLRACETMGNATTVCSDKTGTLTMNKMSLVAATIGSNVQFGRTTGVSNDAASTVNSEGQADDKPLVPSVTTDDAVPAVDFLSRISTAVKTVLSQSIIFNSTAFEGEQDGIQTFIGSKTETALLEFARTHLAIGPLQQERSNANVVQVVPFDSAVKYMACVIKLEDGTFRAYAKGASEILLAKCTKIVEDPASDALSQSPLGSDDLESLKHVISTYASRSLRTIALLYKDFPSWPPAESIIKEDPTQANFSEVFHDMTLLGIVGIQDPLRPGVKEAVIDCQNAGVIVRMVTGDNVNTARSIALKCGIITPTDNFLVLEGKEFNRRIRSKPDGEVKRNILLKFL